MRIIERSPFRGEDGEISLENRIRGTLEYGLSWYAEMTAQEVVTERLNRSFPTDYVLIRNLEIPQTGITAPMILISPQGARVIVASPARGIFRAKGEDWQTFDSRRRSFKRARPNPQEFALEAAETLRNYLNRLGLPLPEVEAVLIMSNPRTHVDTVRPRARIIQRDAIDHFAANLQKQQPILDREDIDTVRDALINPPKSPKAELELEEEASRTPLPDAKPGEAIGSDPFELEQRGPSRLAPRRMFGMTRNQWIVLVVLGFFQLIVIVFFALLLAFS